MTDQSYSFKKIYHLKAQTPMIHFQWNQNGVTLRASEVKPKLDKFLISKLGGFEKALDQKENWLLGYPLKHKSNYKPALNYKLTVTASQIQIDDVPKYGLYYGNMGDKSEEKKAKYVLGDCSMTVTCLIEELQEFIDKNIREFFIVHNFGRMNDKGFGSFVIEGQYDENEVGKALCDNFGCSYLYWFDCNNCSDTMKNEIFNSIKTLYSVMKSGYNIKERYHRSFLFEYFHDKNIGNEKAYLKKKKLSPYNNGNPVGLHKPKQVYSDAESDEYLYVRALLGVGEKIEYIIGYDYNYEKNGYLPKREKLQVSIKSEEIERFPSPVFFKVIGNRVYYIAKRINSIIFDKEFKFSVKYNKKINYGEIEVNPNENVILKTPGEFDVDDFLEYFHENYDPFAQGYGIRSEIQKIKTGGEKNE